MENNRFQKNKTTDSVWWLDTPAVIGELWFSFDRQTVFNLFRDYPQKLTAEQKATFDRENPFWAELLQPL